MTGRKTKMETTASVWNLREIKFFFFKFSLNYKSTFSILSLHQ